jgi:hypothetical protein
MIRLIALVFLSFVSLVQLTGQTYKIPLITKIGGYPITNRIVIGLFEDSEFIPMGVPIQFTDYKVFEAEYMPIYGIMSLIICQKVKSFQILIR